MRIRYQMLNQESVAECDLTDKEANKRFNELKKNQRCVWVELVGEDDHNYMEIIKSFDQPADVIKVQRVFEELFK